ncbi:MAG: hypothetical protein GXP22_03555 [Gammaproteobacteria bacterium]|nr:hypothetical protein [Gammaproteobacteria bacterium]
MKIEDGKVTFEYLFQPSTIVGETDSIEATTPSFVASNAKSVARKVESLSHVEELGKAAARQLTSLFG